MHYMNRITGQVESLEDWDLTAQELDAEVQDWIDNKELIEVVKDESTGEWIEE